MQPFNRRELLVLQIGQVVSSEVDTVSILDKTMTGILVTKNKMKTAVTCGFDQIPFVLF